VVITDATLDNFPVYGMIYYQVQVNTGNEKKWRWKVEWYDDKYIYYFIENDGGNFVPDDSYFATQEEHGFDIMPLVQFDNNLLKISDFELVRALIDCYDNALSYALNDNESFSNALMIFKDVSLTQQLIDKARYLRGIEINSTQAKPDPSVSYLTKDIKIENTNELCKLMEENIFKFSSTVDIYNEAFSGGSVSGESRKQQLIPLELKCKETERLFQLGLRNMFNVVATYWNKVNGITVNPEEIEFIFVRSVIPTEQTIDQLIRLYETGLISKETAISKLDFIDDADSEIEKIDGEDGEVEDEPPTPETEMNNNNNME
jgi:SPP1 family phage portal protein